MIQCSFICLLDDLSLGFCYSNLTWETSGFKLASTISLVLQVNRLTKCASYPWHTLRSETDFDIPFRPFFYREISDYLR